MGILALAQVVRPGVRACGLTDGAMSSYQEKKIEMFMRLMGNKK